jgi:RNA polymerase sigma factor (sigma-70 family)
MTLVDDGSTSPTLLNEVGDWQNHPAWVQFRRRYDPLLRRWCRDFGLDADSVDEVCQRIWIELAARMKTFRYDPKGTFRGWLKQLCRSRVVDFLRQRHAPRLVSIDDRHEEHAGAVHTGAVCELAMVPSEPDDGGEYTDPLQLLLRREAEIVQAAVRKRVNQRSWDAFWLVAVRDWNVKETATALGMTHIAVYAARDRVARMLCDEGKRVSDGWPANADGPSNTEG